MIATNNTETMPKTAKHYLGVPIFAIGVVVAALPRLGYFAYESTAGMPMRCYATANAEIAVGTAIFLCGALYFFAASAKVRLVASLSAIVAAAFALLFPTVLTGLCGDAHMACHMLTLPALVASSALIALFALVGVTLSARSLLRARNDRRPTEI
jgi:hypothetical protein